MMQQHDNGVPSLEVQGWHLTCGDGFEEVENPIHERSERRDGDSHRNSLQLPNSSPIRPMGSLLVLADCTQPLT